MLHGENKFIVKLTLAPIHATDIHFSFSTDCFFTSAITIPKKKQKEFFILSFPSSNDQTVYFIDKAAKAKDAHVFNDIAISEELCSFIKKLLKGVCFVSFERVDRR